MKDRLTDQRFQQARMHVLREVSAAQGIGTLGEKSLHRMLKLTVEPDTAMHEVKHLGRVADVVTEGEVVEIQTRNFSKLRPKLDTFLPHGPVTVIYPLAEQNYIRTIDPLTGELSPRRKSPKHATAFDSLPEFCRILSYIGHPALTLCLVFFDMEEYRMPKGCARGNRRRTQRVERMANRLCRTLILSDAQSYRAAFVPEDLPHPFTVNDFARAAKIKPRWAYTAIRLLEQLEVVHRAGNAGRAYLYEVLSP